ncbi:MAG: hypothetical protein LBC67_01780 [Spirochaetales bacterium]|jgi:hypothetical protein|nr:hypothetical protein [Spirochaetales bacterium]
MSNTYKTKEGNGFSSEIPAEDLEQYGVWIKAGPETVEDTSFPHDDFGLEDFSEAGTGLTDEEETLLGSLEEKSRDEESPFSFNEDDFSFPDLEELEDITSPDDSGAEPKAEAGLASDDFSLDSLDVPEEEPLDFGDNFELAPEDSPGLVLEDGATVDGNISFGDIDVETPATPSALPGENEFRVNAGIDWTSLETEEPASLGELSGENFSDIAAVEEAMTEEDETGEPSAAPSGAQGREAGGDVLSHIEEELASIKAELAELKKELTGLRSAGGFPPAEESARTGFFAGDADDDETIALTGDELNNILTTADITEENAEAAAPEAESGKAIAIEEEPAGETETIDIDFDLDSGSGEEEKAQDSQEEIALDFDTEAPAALPLSTPEEQAIIEEYNRELDTFDAEEEISRTQTGALEEDLPEIEEKEEAPPPAAPKEPKKRAAKAASARPAPAAETEISDNITDEIKSVLKYMDQLLEDLPEDKIQEFTHSEHFDVYRRLFKELGLE